MTSTFMLSRLLGWSYFEKLGQQHVMQVQSSTEPPKKLALGERPVMVDGTESSAFLELDRGAPIKLVYAAEGTPIVPGSAAVMKDAPHPNAARLLTQYLFSPEGQQILVDLGHYRSFEPGIKEPPGVTPLAAIKLLTADPAQLLKVEDEIKQKYAEDFGT